MFIMIGIYKFTNKITGESYIGQSKNIHKRYNQHKCTYQPNKKYYENTYFHSMLFYYGFDNFDFEVLEECKESELKSKEIFYIQKYNTIYPNGYNISAGGDMPHYMKLNNEVLDSILFDLSNNTLTELQIANKYGLHPTTISSINIGKTWRDKSREYPIRKVIKKTYNCKKCGKRISQKCKTNMCSECYNKEKTKNIPDRDTLYNLLLQESFVGVAKLYDVSDNAVRKWCKKYKIPSNSYYYRNRRETCS